MVKEYPKPSVTVDIIIFTIKEKDLKVLLVKRAQEPFKNMWAIPGGFVHINESLDDAAKRELEQETGVKDIYLEQLYTFGEPKRDPRGRVITVTYFALINSENIKLKASTDAFEAKWFSVYSLPELAFDHKMIFNYSIKRLRWKLEYTTVAFKLLPEEFTLTQLQEVYEIILGKKIDKRNFRKKILQLDLVKETKKIKKAAHRPAKLYKFFKKIAPIQEIIPVHKIE